jgi:hypothetical protein
MRRFLLLVLLILALGGGYWYFYLKPKQQIGSTTAQTSFRSFFSLGNKNSAEQDTAGDSTVADTALTPTSINPFTQLSAGPIAGYTTYTTTYTVTTPPATPKEKPTKQTITDHIVRYVSRSNGYVYEIKNDGIPTQISNIFIPNIYEAYFADNNQTVLLRFLRDDSQTIATYSVPIPELNPDGTRTQKDGYYLPDNIRSLSVSPDGKLVARLTTDASNAIVTTSDTKGGAVKEVLRTPFREWLLDWKNQLYVQTKASAIANGFLYRVDPTKRLTRIVGTVAGLTSSVSPKGTYVLYSESSETSFTAKILNTKTNSLKPIDASILPEKCVWLPDEDALCAGNTAIASSTYPDDWYKGTTSFMDAIYHVYAANGIITDLTEGNDTPYDMVNLQYNNEQNRLYFIDKKTGFLWQYAL